MSANGERPTNGGGASAAYRSLKSPPPPSFRPPPPMAPPPMAPASPMTRRKLSVNAPFEQQQASSNTNVAKGSPGPRPKPPAAGYPPKRPVEKVQCYKHKFTLHTDVHFILE